MKSGLPNCSSVKSWHRLRTCGFSHYCLVLFTSVRRHPDPWSLIAAGRHVICRPSESFLPGLRGACICSSGREQVDLLPLGTSCLLQALHLLCSEPGSVISPSDRSAGPVISNATTPAPASRSTSCRWQSPRGAANTAGGLRRWSIAVLVILGNGLRPSQRCPASQPHSSACGVDFLASEGASGAGRA